MSEPERETSNQDRMMIAEPIITSLYARIGRPPPLFLWFDDPTSCVLAWNLATLLPRDSTQLTDSREGFLPIAVKRPAGGQIQAQLWTALDRYLDAEVRGMPSFQWHDRHRAALGRFWNAFWSELERHAGPEVGHELRGALYDQHGIDAENILRDRIPAGVRGFWGGSVEGGAPLAPSSPGARRLHALQGTCGWFFPCERFVFCSHEPRRISVDPRQRLHAEHGPALALSSSYPIHAWHGTRVPREWIEEREAIDPLPIVTGPSSRQRETLIEILGWARVLARLPTRVIDTDRDPQIGTLLECDRLASFQSRFLLVRCGTGREFALRVPRELNTALEANAWTYGLIDNEYQLEARS